MPLPGAQDQANGLLRAMNAAGGYALSLVCTERGLLIAADGEGDAAEVAAGITSLFDDLVARATRDLAFTGVDEITLSDPRSGRFVVRPLTRGLEPRLFLVVVAPRGRAWRRNTNLVARKLLALLRPWLTPTAPEP
jgi:hypothetical protein